MHFEVSERIDTSIERSEVMNLAITKFRKISDSAKIKDDQIIVRGVEATFGSINRADRTIIDAKQLSGGWLLTAEVAYRPSVMFWVFFVAGFFAYIGWIIPIAFYLLQRNTVKSAVANVLSSISNEMRETPALAPITTRPSAIDELAKLADLKDRGVLSEEEFAAQKLQLLRA